MSNKVVYFNGVRLWENLKHWKPTLVRTGASRKGGASRRLGKLNSRSPNFFYEVMVHTDVKPVTAVSDLGRQETFNLQMLQVQKDLIEQGNAPGYLAWCQDDAEVLTVAAPVSTPGSFPGAGTWNYTGAGYTAAAGQYALLRDPTSGEGFVTLLTAAGGGSAAGTFQQQPAAGWEMIRIRFFFENVAFVGMGGWETAVQAEDRHAFDVTYAFESDSHPIYPAGYVMDLS